METTVTKIVNSADNQNIVYDSSGILCRTQDDLTGTYNPCQSRWINSGLYVTDDGWQTVKAAIGKYIYIDPETGNEVTTMGVIGDTIVGKLIIGENLGIYNINNSMTFDMNGLKITNGINTFTVNPNNISKLLKISKSDTDIFYVDDNGNLNLTGNINGCSFDGGKINIGDSNFVVNEDGSVISKSTITGATLRGGSIGIGGNNNENFVVNSDGSVISKASLSFGDGALTYDPTNGMSIKGDIYATTLSSIGIVHLPAIKFENSGSEIGFIRAMDSFIQLEGNLTIYGELCSDLQGNSSTATKLKTPRTIKIGDASKTFDGSANVTWSLSAIGAASTSEFASAVSHINSLSERVSDLEAKVNNLTK